MTGMNMYPRANPPTIRLPTNARFFGPIISEPKKQATDKEIHLSQVFFN